MHLKLPEQITGETPGIIKKIKGESSEKFENCVKIVRQISAVIFGKSAKTRFERFGRIFGEYYFQKFLKQLKKNKSWEYCLKNISEIHTKNQKNIHGKIPLRVLEKSKRNV